MKKAGIKLVLLAFLLLAGCTAYRLPPAPEVTGKPLPLTVGILESGVDDAVLLDAFRNTGLFREVQIFRRVGPLPDVIVEIESEMHGEPADPLCRKDCGLRYSSKVSFRRPLSAAKEYMEYSHESAKYSGLSGVFLRVSPDWARDYEKERYYRQVAFRVYSKVSAGD